MAQESNLQVAPQDAKKAAPPAADVSVHFKRNLFIEGQSSNNRINRDGHRATGENARRSELVSQPESLRRDYSEFLDSYVQSLVRIQERNASILNGREHAPEREMLNLLTRTDNGVMQADSAKIRAFLEKPEGWMIATQVIEQQAAFKMFALGLYEAIKPEGVRNARPGDPNHVHLDIGRGAVNRWLHNRTDGVGSRIAAAFDNINPWNSGTVVDIRQSGAVLQSIKGSANAAQERQYILEMYGIDVNDFSVATVGSETRIALNPVQMSRRNANEVRDETIDALYMRREFYASLGVPESNLDALPEQYLYNYSEQVGTNNPTAIGMERSGAVWQSRIEEAFNSGNGIVDIAGNPRLTRGPNGELIPNSRFRVNQAQITLTPVAIDFPSTLRNYREARAKVMTDMIRTYIQREMSRPDPERPIATIKEKITARGEGGTEVAKRREVHEKRKGRYEAYRGLVGTDRNKLETYKKAQESLKKARDEARAQGYNDTTAIDTAITTKRSQIDKLTIPPPAAGTGSVTEEIARIRAEREAEIVRRRTGIEAGFTAHTSQKEKDRALNENRDAVNQMYQPELDAQADRQKRLEAEIAKLQTLKESITKQEDTLKDTSPTASETAKLLEAMGKNFTDLTVAGTGITDNDLRTRTVDDIMALIHTKNAADIAAGRAPAFGWPESGDAKDANRLIVLRAMDEARARDTLTRRANNAQLVADFGTVTGFGISENELRVLSPIDIQKKVAAVAGSGWAAPPTTLTTAQQTELANAMMEAQARVDVRFGVMKDQVDSLEQQVDAAQTALEAVSLKDEVGRLSVTADVMARQGEVFSQVNDLMTDAARFTDTTAVNATDSTLSTSEKATYTYTITVPGAAGAPPVAQTVTAQYPRGYLEMMNMMFDYRERADRDEYFKMAAAVMTPDKMRQVLVASGRLQGNTLDEVLTDFRTKISGRAAAPGVAPEEPSFGPLETQQMMKRLVNQLRDEALAM